MFKVGITNNPKSRVSKLQRHVSFDLGVSVWFPCFYIGEDHVLESMVNERFSSFKIKNLHKFDGCTEFYSIDVLDQVFCILFQNSISKKHHFIKSFDKLPSKLLV